MRPPQARRARTALAGVVLVAALVVALSPDALAAAPSLGFSPPVAFDAGGAPTAVSCPSESLCVAVDGEGRALSTFSPTAFPQPWGGIEVDAGGRPLTAVSCAPGGLCVAVDAHGQAFANVAPGSPSWSAASIDSGKGLTGVSCPTSSLCVAVDESGNVLTSGSPASGAWSTAGVDAGHRLKAVSCATPSMCVAVDDAGRVLSSSNPAGGEAAWHGQRIDPGELLAVSCSTAGACVASDAAGNVVASANPMSAAATWSITPVDSERLTALSCASSGLCVAVDGRGLALASDGPAAPIPSWSVSSADPGQSLAGISCVAGGFCLALDTAGRSVAGRVPAPAATTLTPTEVTATNATLAGVVNANDAVLGACTFEYGSGVPYSQSLPCALLPAAAGGAEGVSAELSGLAPNTTYHYRVLASSPAGTTAGEDVAFTTAVSSLVALVFPHPSVTGTPAAGQRLTCHPGTPAGTSARLSYAWLRDLIPIPGATGSNYTVRNQDTGRHLQCQATASNAGGSATAKSAFVTIPVQGVEASSGETVVGRAAFRGSRVSVPVICSAQASGGCQIALRLSVVETLSGSRVVALAARWNQHAHGGAAALRHVTVTLAAARVHLTRGSHRVLLAPLNATGRRLLASRRSFAASLSVTGTVIGVIEAQLRQQIVTVGAVSRRASSHAAPRR